MADPTAFAGTALSLAVTATRNHLERAHEAEAETAERCSEYVHAAYEAVHGLEREYDEIVEEARSLDLDDGEERRLLLQRIDRFVRQENLRPSLIIATEGLREAQASLQRDANRFFRRLTPSVRARQLQATSRMSELLQKLVRYLDGLTPVLDEQHLRPDRPDPSAPELERLQELERLVSEAGILADAAARDRVRQQIGEMLQNRDKGQFLYMAGEAGGAAEELIAAFR
jgi:hypothetical protein